MSQNYLCTNNGVAYTPPRLDELTVVVEHGFAGTFDDGILDDSNSNNLPDWD